ncbi:uncharacterized protein [Dermacentor albipictus]|uniref:uncharacterized protein isoform X3 n=1 Tax=Dermacentor albipictus TaxID=60249 RepID=UPI0038FD240B
MDHEVTSSSEAVKLAAHLSPGEKQKDRRVGDRLAQPDTGEDVPRCGAMVHSSSATSSSKTASNLCWIKTATPTPLMACPYEKPYRKAGKCRHHSLFHTDGSWRLQGRCLASRLPLPLPRLDVPSELQTMVLLEHRPHRPSAQKADFQGHVLNDPTKDLAEDIANHIASRPGGVSLRLPELLWLRRAACCSLALFPSPVPSQDLTRDENGWNQLSTLGTIPPIWWSR